jgi:hypothetical protein
MPKKQGTIQIYKHPKTGTMGIDIELHDHNVFVSFEIDTIEYNGEFNEELQNWEPVIMKNKKGTTVSLHESGDLSFSSNNGAMSVEIPKYACNAIINLAKEFNGKPIDRAVKIDIFDEENNPTLLNNNNNPQGGGRRPKKLKRTRRR